jgi:hypothetical protein
MRTKQNNYTPKVKTMSNLIFMDTAKLETSIRLNLERMGVDFWEIHRTWRVMISKIKDTVSKPSIQQELSSRIELARLEVEIHKAVQRQNEESKRAVGSN